MRGAALSIQRCSMVGLPLGTALCSASSSCTEGTQPFSLTMAVEHTENVIFLRGVPWARVEARGPFSGVS